MKHSDANHTDIGSTKLPLAYLQKKKIVVKPHPQLLILMLFPSFNMHHKYRGPGRKWHMEIVIRYGTEVNRNKK
jgi:hypothetical protein